MAEGSAATAYRRVRQAIIEGTYPPGARLVEQRLAEELDLSRTPVREALRSLHAEGLVDIEPNRGTVVRRVTVDDIADVYELRARLEAYAAERAAARLLPADERRLDDALVAFEAAVDAAMAGDHEARREVSRWNHDFHDALVAAARHQRLAAILARTVDQVLAFQAFRRFTREELRRSAVFHRLIRDAVVHGQGGRAGALMAEHILQGRDVLLAAVAGLPSLDDLFAARAGGDALYR
jgi:DNA-binding GntR family transcriptional regulator